VSRPDPVATTDRTSAGAERVDDLVSRLSRIAGVPWSVAGAPDGGSPVAPGLALDGPDDARRDVAATVLADALRAEQEIASLCGEVLERYEEVSLVYRLCDRLGSVVGDGEIARLVLREAATVLGAERGEVWLHRGDAVVRVATTDGTTDGALPDRRGRLRPLYDGRPWIERTPADGPSAIAVALPDPGREPLGVLVLEGRIDGRPYRSGEVKLLNALAALTSAFVRNDALAASARLAEAKRREDEIARQIHAGLLPHEEPRFEGLDVAARFRSADTVGGDYFGYLRLADGVPAIVMADISGHGVGAAMYMAAAKGAIQAEAGRQTAPSDLLRRLNETLAADFSRSNVFATAFLLRHDHPKARISYASAGHPPPLLVRADGTCEPLERGGLALGVVPSVLYHEESRPFGSGDRLVIFTDGLPEARNGAGEFYGTERLARCIAALGPAPADDLCDAVLADLDRFRDGASRQDDVTLICVRATDGGAA